MKLKRTIKVGKAVIDVWEDDSGNIILGGIDWYEYFDYMQHNLETYHHERKTEKQTMSKRKQKKKKKSGKEEFVEWFERWEKHIKTGK